MVTVCRAHHEPRTIGAEGDGNRGMSPSCLITCKHAPDFQSQSRTVSSVNPVEAIKVPSGEMATECTLSLMALQRPDAGSRFQVPDLDGLVIRTRNGKPSVRRDLDGIHDVRMALQRRQAFARFEVPEPDSPVAMPRQRLRPRWIDGAAENVVCVALSRTRSSSGTCPKPIPTA